MQSFRSLPLFSIFPYSFQTLTSVVKRRQTPFNTCKSQILHFVYFENGHSRNQSRKQLAFTSVIYIPSRSSYLHISKSVSIYLSIYLSILRDPHCTNLDRRCRMCENILGKKTLAKEKYITQLNSVLFINITKDLQYYIFPRYA